jgi:U3 small nucleolar RNA-associated protein 3
MPVTEGLDVPDEDTDGLRQGLAMMEAELGRLESDDDGGDQLDDELDGELDEDEDFYTKITKKSKDKKNFKRELYKVAPKYPGIEAEVEGERAVSRQILKNRGLVAHKSKLNRNPRVKKREQYRKALVRRKGAVREVRTNEGHKYGGEETGIKSGLSRSRKLAR